MAHSSLASLRRGARLAVLALLSALLAAGASAQDGSSSLRGVVEDSSGARVAGAKVTLVNADTGVKRQTAADDEGNFTFSMLAPGKYTATSESASLSVPPIAVQLTVGEAASLRLQLHPVGAAQTVTVVESTSVLDTEAGDVSHVVSETAIEGLPLNGRRFTDLALLTPGVTQDPRGLTSNSNGDLSFGGVRGFQNNFEVDGTDNNNSFFAQATGRYRAPYQFSNEVVKEFRVSSNSYSAELGRAGGAVFNVATKSGSNDWHGTAFYYIRDQAFEAQPRFTEFKPTDQQQQFGATIGGPLRKDRLFFFAGHDRHLLTVPAVVRFGSGQPTVVPAAADYEASDQSLVFAAAQKLSAMGGEYPTYMSGNATFAKVDYVISSKHLAFVRVNTSRYSGTNNVFFSPGSPITSYAESGNGEEDVATETVAGSLTSVWSTRLASSLRAQFSHDLQQSTANSDDPRTKIYNILQGFGRSDILPRSTNEHKLQVAETFSYTRGRLQMKFGGDFLQGWIYNYYPTGFGGAFYFESVRVNPWTFAPMVHGMTITPLRAYAHDVPRYYLQNFGTAATHPNSRSYSAFVQNTFRATRSLTLNLGLRYDLQTFQPGTLVSNPLYEPSGKVPTDTNNVSPRVGFAYSVGRNKPLLIRGGFGLFYSQVPAIYAAQVATDNGLTQSSVFLDLRKPAEAALFPTYSQPLVHCPPGTLTCTAPASIAPFATTKISAFAPDFQTPYVEQGSLTVEREVSRKLKVSASYLYVHGLHLIRSMDKNLPKPKITTYPVYNDDGSVFLNTYYQVASFADWQTTWSATCPYPPCINDVRRPNPRLGAINSFESSSASLYNGFALSVKRQAPHGLFVQAGYTYAKAVDDGPDSLVVGRSGNVQNSYATILERGPSVDEQRHRLFAAWVYQPQSVHYSRPAWNVLLNHWQASSIITAGSGRPLNATMAGDANQDGNLYNDRLPGASRNSYTGPDYMTLDLRLTRTINLSEHARLQLMAESFNVTNRSNLRVDIADDGFYNSAGQFVSYSAVIGKKQYPGKFQLNSNFLVPNNAYAQRQVQFSLRLNY